MWGRFSFFPKAMYLADEERRRFEETASSQRDGGVGLGVLLRLLGVLAVGFGVAAAIASA